MKVLSTTSAAACLLLALAAARPAGAAVAAVCDVVAQVGCGPGQKCTLLSDGPGCAPDGTVTLGGVCTSIDGLDDCVAGTYCVDGGCELLCDAARPDSCSGWSTCTAVAGDGFGVCLPPEGCDVVAQVGCGPGQKCTLLSDGPGCAPDGTVTLGGVCTSIDGLDDCVAGTYCVDGGCELLCDAARPASCSGSESCSVIDGENLGVCLASSPPGVTCSSDEDCKAGTYCAVDGTCHPDSHRPREGSTCPPEPTLWNFRSGRVCTRPDGTQEVCEDLVDIEIDGRDRCEFNHETVRCNWFGYEFDYAGMDPNVPILCDWVRSMPADEGNRDGIRQESATNGTTELRLPAASGHFISPGFQNHATPPGGAAVVVSARFDCSYAGSPLFDVEYRFHFKP
jgi:hypothetical protein